MLLEHLLTHSLTYSCTYSCTYSLTYSCTHSCTHSCTNEVHCISTVMFCYVNITTPGVPPCMCCRALTTLTGVSSLPLYVYMYTCILHCTLLAQLCYIPSSRSESSHKEYLWSQSHWATSRASSSPCRGKDVAKFVGSPWRVGATTRVISSQTTSRQRIAERFGMASTHAASQSKLSLVVVYQFRYWLCSFLCRFFLVEYKTLWLSYINRSTTSWTTGPWHIKGIPRSGPSKKSGGVFYQLSAYTGQCTSFSQGSGRSSRYHCGGVYWCHCTTVRFDVSWINIPYVHRFGPAKNVPSVSMIMTQPWLWS
jgi:hypothetical protein